MALYIHHMNAKSWVNLVLIIPKDRPSTERRQEPALKKKFGNKKGNNTITQHAVDDIILQEKEKVGVKDETYENIDDVVDKYYIYELDKFILDEKKRRKCTFESKLKHI